MLEQKEPSSKSTLDQSPLLNKPEPTRAWWKTLLIILSFPLWIIPYAIYWIIKSSRPVSDEIQGDAPQNNPSNPVSSTLPQPLTQASETVNISSNLQLDPKDPTKTSKGEEPIMHEELIGSRTKPLNKTFPLEPNQSHKNSNTISSPTPLDVAPPERLSVFTEIQSMESKQITQHIANMANGYKSAEPVINKLYDEKEGAVLMDQILKGIFRALVKQKTDSEAAKNAGRAINLLQTTFDSPYTAHSFKNNFKKALGSPEIVSHYEQHRLAEALYFKAVKDLAEVSDSKNQQDFKPSKELLDFYSDAENMEVMLDTLAASDKLKDLSGMAKKAYINLQLLYENNSTIRQSLQTVWADDPISINQLNKSISYRKLHDLYADYAQKYRANEDKSSVFKQYQTEIAKLGEQSWLWHEKPSSSDKTLACLREPTNKQEIIQELIREGLDGNAENHNCILRRYFNLQFLPEGCILREVHQLKLTIESNPEDSLLY